jgi:hypothetical protein
MVLPRNACLLWGLGEGGEVKGKQSRHLGIGSIIQTLSMHEMSLSREASSQTTTSDGGSSMVKSCHIILHVGPVDACLATRTPRGGWIATLFFIFPWVGAGSRPEGQVRTTAACRWILLA